MNWLPYYEQTYEHSTKNNVKFHNHFCAQSQMSNTQKFSGRGAEFFEILWGLHITDLVSQNKEKTHRFQFHQVDII